MFAMSNPYQLILARQLSINKHNFGTKIHRSKIRYGNYDIKQLAAEESTWVGNRWHNLEKQMARFVEQLGYEIEIDDITVGGEPRWKT